MTRFPKPPEGSWTEHDRLGSAPVHKIAAEWVEEYQKS